MSFNSLWLPEQMRTGFLSIITALNSVGRIGLAPIYGHTFDEDVKAAKVPSQMFAGAANRLRSRFHYLPSIRRMSFEVLPTIARITSSQRARQARRWLDLDAVLWGSYLSANPPRIWLNIERPPDEGGRRDEEPSRSSDMDPFRGLYGWEPEMLVVEQSDPLDTYLALVITTVQTLKARRPKGIFLFKGWQWVDKIFAGRYECEKALSHLVTEVLFAIDAPVQTDVLYPTAKATLVDLTGRWIGDQLSTLRSAFDEEYSQELLVAAASKCVELQPDAPGHLYRLAALQCIAGNAEATSASLKEALDKQRHVYRHDWARFRSRADMCFSFLDNTIYDEKNKILLAKALVYSAMAIAADEDKDEAKASLRDELRGTTFNQLQAFREEDVSPQAAMLYELLGKELPNQSSKGAGAVLAEASAGITRLVTRAKQVLTRVGILRK